MASANIVGMFCGIICMFREALGTKFGYIDVGLFLAGVLLLFV